VKYHCKTDIEPYIAQPIRLLTYRLETVIKEIATGSQQREENSRRRNDAERQWHEENIGIQRASLRVQRRAACAAAILSAGTLAILIFAYLVYSRQAEVMNNQASIMTTQATLTKVGL
jgi:hypothetical protein